jgi:hypothetical protein
MPPKMPPSFSSVSQDDTISVGAGDISLCSVQQAQMFYVWREAHGITADLGIFL